MSGGFEKERIGGKEHRRRTRGRDAAPRGETPAANKMLAESETADALLVAVEERLRDRSRTPVGEAQPIVQSLILAGGKRLRPDMLLRLGVDLGIAPLKLIAYATAVEIAHSGTLLQDDVIDESPRRRGRPSAWARWGPAAGILGGDFLFMRAIDDLLSEGLVEGARWLAETIRQLAEGEMLQQQIRWRADAAEADIALIAHRKSGALFAWICRILALEAGLRQDRALAWGSELGYGFQLADDLLDFHAEGSGRKTTGKPARKDLREGYVTLPVCRVMESEPTLRRAVDHAFASRSETAFDQAYDLLLRSPASPNTRRDLLRLERSLCISAAGWLPESGSAPHLVRECLIRER